MINFWISFASSGDPGDDWPQYTNETQLSMRFDLPTSQIEAKLKAQQCDFWDKHDVYIQP
jgi:carboxylesterase type B